MGSPGPAPDDDRRRGKQLCDLIQAWLSFRSLNPNSAAFVGECRKLGSSPFSIEPIRWRGSNRNRLRLDQPVTQGNRLTREGWPAIAGHPCAELRQQRTMLPHGRAVGPTFRARCVAFSHWPSAASETASCLRGRLASPNQPTVPRTRLGFRQSDQPIVNLSHSTLTVIPQQPQHLTFKLCWPSGRNSCHDGTSRT